MSEKEAKIAKASDAAYDAIFPYGRGGGYGMFVRGFTEGVKWYEKQNGLLPSSAAPQYVEQPSRKRGL